MKSLYERLVRPMLFSLEAETAHHFTIGSLGRASHFDRALSVLKRFAPPSKPKTLFGLTFPNPIGLAAGLDKNGVALPAWAALGFGFIEIGRRRRYYKDGEDARVMMLSLLDLGVRSR